MALGTPLESDEVRTFGSEELFFSVTDRRGIITLVNETFERLAEHSRTELIGTAHNVIRHPDMPGGAFTLIWDELEAGRPVCAYVANRSASGARYDVFATIVPVGKSYLSIRLRPEMAETRDLLFSAYDRARAEELRAREEGASARDAARAGADLLLGTLAGLGHRGIADASASLLSAELLAHRRSAQPKSEHRATAGELATVIGEADALDGELTRLAASLQELTALTERLRGLDERFAPAEAGLANIAEEVSAVISGLDAIDAPEDEHGTIADAVAASRRIVEQLDEARDSLRAAPPLLATTAGIARETLMRVSLLSLDVLMIARFGREITVPADAGARNEELTLLHSALHDGSAAVADSIERIRVAQTEIPGALSHAVAGVDRARRRLARWRGTLALLDEEGVLGDSGDDVTAGADRALGRSAETAQLLSEIIGAGSALGLLTIPFEAEGTDARITRLGQAVSRLGAGPEPTAV